MAELGTIKAVASKRAWGVLFEQMGPHHSRIVCGELGRDNLLVLLAGVQSYQSPESSALIASSQSTWNVSSSSPSPQLWHPL